MRDLTWRGDILFLRDGAGMDVALAPADEPRAMPPWFHFGFRLADHAAVGRLHGEMAAAAVAVTAPLSREDDFSFFRCADPDGYCIEVYYEPDPARRLLRLALAAVQDADPFAGCFAGIAVGVAITAADRRHNVGADLRLDRADARAADQLARAGRVLAVVAFRTTDTDRAATLLAGRHGRARRRRHEQRGHRRKREPAQNLGCDTHDRSSVDCLHLDATMSRDARKLKLSRR